MAKGVMGIFAAVLCTFCLTGCTNEDNEGRKITDYREVILTVASKKVPGVLDGYNYVSEVYAVKKGQADRWNTYGHIAGFEYEEGYEYKIKVSETTYLDYSMRDPSWTERDLLGIISKDKKDSDGLPLHLIPEKYYENIPMPRYRYAVEADNNKLIENELTSNPIFPADYRYTYYHSEGCMKWIGIQDDCNVFGPYSIKQSSSKPEEMPESYKLLPPDGRVIGGSEWSFLDEDGNETDFSSFDIFFGYADKTKSAGPSPDTVFVYKDLTQHYRTKYPDAGVKTIVVSYSFHIRLHIINE